MTRTTVSLTILTMLAVTTAETSGQGGKVEITGHIIAADLRQRPAFNQQNRASKFHPVQLVKGQTYVIDLISTDFDAYLEIHNQNGQILYANDDNGNTLDSRIQMVAPYTGVFYLVASPLSNGTAALGGYRLVLTPK